MLTAELVEHEEARRRRAGTRFEAMRGSPDLLRGVEGELKPCECRWGHTGASAGACGESVCHRRYRGWACWLVPAATEVSLHRCCSVSGQPGQSGSTDMTCTKVQTQHP